MKLNLLFILTFLFASGITTVLAQSQSESEEVTWEAYWSEGFKFESSDGRFNFKFGGRIMNDWVVIGSYDDNLRTSLGDPTQGTEFRRVRFFNSGTIYNNIDYKLQFDFVGGDADLKDAYIQINQIPAIDHLKIGRYKEPFGLEELTSSKYITFMARALTSPFQPSRNSGVTTHNKVLDGRMTYAIGTFLNTDGFGSTQAGETAQFNVTGRITGLPWEKENNLVHLGFAYQLRNPDKNEVQYSSEPETHQQPDFVDTETLDNVSDENIMGFELAAVYGPFSIQSEFQRSTLNRTISLDNTQNSETKDKEISTNFSAFYVYGSVFLTKGDHRSYGGGSFGRVKPKKNFGQESGFGALELALRYSDLDLIEGKSAITDGDFVGSSLVEGGELSDITVGLNWYLNPSTRIMFNYVFADVDRGPNNANGDAGFFRTRFQIDF